MNIEQKDIVITAAVRTAIGTFRGSLKDMQANDLGAIVTKEAPLKLTRVRLVLSKFVFSKLPPARLASYKLAR